MNRSVVSAVLSALIGVLPAFFLVFATLFSDGGSVTEYAAALGFIAVVYAALGAGSGYAAGRWQAGFWVSAAAIALVAWYTTREPGQLLLHALVLLTVVGSACGGAAGGAVLKQRRAA